MPVYRAISDPRLSRLHVQEWWRRVLRVVGLLLVTLAICTLGLVVLDSSAQPLHAKISRGVWNALNLVTTLGGFTGLDESEEAFLTATMIAFLVLGGYAVSTLTGILSSNTVFAFRENKKMERKLDDLANHVIVIGFGALGRRVVDRLRDAGEQVVVIDRDDDQAAQASTLGHLVIHGDAGVDNTALDHARVDRAKALVVTTDDPDRKLSITLIAHSRNPTLNIALTGSNPQRATLLQHAGASQVVITDDLIADALVRPFAKGDKA